MSADSGTSFSAPIVAGAAARVWGPLPTLEPQVITYLLRKYAKVRGAQGWTASGSSTSPRALAGAAQGGSVINEAEPNDNQSTRPAEGRLQAGVHAAAGSSRRPDDKFDYWRLQRARHVLRSEAAEDATGGVDANCFRASGRGGGTFIKVTAKRQLGLYTVTVPRR